MIDNINFITSPEFYKFRFWFFFFICNTVYKDIVPSKFIDEFVFVIISSFQFVPISSINFPIETISTISIFSIINFICILLEFKCSIWMKMNLRIGRSIISYISMFRKSMSNKIPFPIITHKIWDCL